MQLPAYIKPSILSFSRRTIQCNQYRMMSAIAMPALRKQMADGSEAEISEEELYRYTRYRWLCDEGENLATRYRKFNISALTDAAVKAVGGNVRSCVKLLKCIEGQYNKAFLMTMDNGVEVLTKIPNPNAGPAFYTTASEVATRDFIRTVLNLPVPRIYAYSVDSRNLVGAEYIIEERASGSPLGNLWPHWSTESQHDLVTQLVDFEAKLTSISFPRHGCIFYKRDLEKKGLPTYGLEARYRPSTADRIDPELLEKFAFGPLTEARLWEDERVAMDLDRGPWSDPLSYMVAMGINEIKWARSFAKPRINKYRSMTELESPDDYISLLQRYLTLVPHLSPGPFRTSLSHPDLHLDNIFVDPDTRKITCIIDWQSAAASEPFLQHITPRMLLPVNPQPSETADFNSLSGLYQDLTRLKTKERWAAMNLHNRSLLTEPVSLLCGAWSRNDVFSFRHALIHVVSRWQDIASTPCPIQFTDRELELHSNELELIEGLGEVLHQLQNSNLIPLGGMVLRENYEQALHINNSVREMFIDMAESESQKALYSQIWPYQDQGS